MNIDKFKYKTKLWFYLIVYLIKNPSQLKYFGNWLNYYLKSLFSNPINYGIPWLNFPTIKYLEKYLHNGMNVFEWGAGGSTIFIAKRVKGVISIEYDYNYYGFLNKKLEELSIQNAEVRFIAPQSDGKIKSKNVKGDNKFFDKYVDAISEFPDNYFDIIIIDGRARNHCLEKSLNKVKRGGFILFDNTDRKDYKSNLSLLDNWETKTLKGIIPFSLYQSEALIAKKEI